MSFIDKLGDSIVSMSKDVGQKAKEASGIAKLKLDIRIKQEYVKEQYAQLGKVYYEAHKDEDVPEKQQFEKIAEALDEIDQMELQVLELKKARRCPNCGVEASDTAEFCSNCGAKLGVVVGEGKAEDVSGSQPTEDVELEEEPDSDSEWL
ncbi:MAG: zinc ribbon domain-containing protein [Roseburia sp.]|nr:zinc ribbon domain-containing protein [Roseburia sp.]